MRAARVLCALAMLASDRLHAADGPIRVVTLSTVLTEVARQVGGSQATVEGLVLQGVDPHTFNPSPRDIRAIVDADLVLASGLNVEGYLNRLLTNDVAIGRVVLVGDALPFPITSISRDGMIEEDPHWWHSIDNVLAAVEIVRSELARMRPASAAEFAANAKAYSGRLMALKEWVAAEVGKIPADRQSINGFSTEGEPDARRVAAVIDLIRSRGIKAVFVEGGVNPSLVENLRRETGVRLGATLYADGLGAPGSGADTYESMYRTNVSAIVDGLSQR